MKLPSSYLPRKIRSAVRFAVVGTTGMFVQTGFFEGALWAMGHPAKGMVLYYIAFGIGFVLEMIPNYLFSNWYTFGTKPNKKNAGGFLLARAINLGIQFGLLPSLRDDLVSYLVIFIGGCINYFVCLIFFKRPKDENL